MQLVVGQAAPESAARGAAGAVERIAGIRHAVQFEDGPQAAFVERRIVGHERQPRDTGFDFVPHRRKIRRFDRIFIGQAMDRRRKMAVKIGPRANQAVKRIDHLAAAHDNDAHGADTRALSVGRFEIYGCKIFHRICICVLQIYAFLRRGIHPERKKAPSIADGAG